MMVKEGKLWVTLNGVSRALGAGSVALALPGDRIIASNIGGYARDLLPVHISLQSADGRDARPSAGWP